MSATFDTTTKTAYDAATTAAARATAIVASLSSGGSPQGSVLVKVYNGASPDAEMGSGTMTAPWATASGGTVVIGEVSSFTVGTTGTPNASWYIKFRTLDGTRWVRASFGLVGSTQDFTWSLETFTAGQTGTIGTATIVCTGNAAPVFTVAPTTASIASTGGTLQFTATDPDGGTILYALSTTRSGITINSSTGLVTVTAAAAGTSGNIVVQASDGILTTSTTCAVTVLTEYALIAGDDWDTFPLGPLADGYSYPKFGGTIRHSLSGYATGTGVASPWASVCVSSSASPSSPVYGTGRAFEFYVPGNTTPPGEFRCQHELSNFEGYPTSAQYPIEGREVWAGFAIRLDSAFPYPSEGYPFFFGAHAAVGQYDGSPWGIRFMRTGATQWRFNMEQAGTSSYGVDLGDYSADRGQWVRWVIHMKYSLIGQGWAKVWKNGVQVVNRTGFSTLHPTCTAGPFIKWGIYNDRMRDYASVDERITLDAIRIANENGSYALVAPENYL